MIVDKPRPLPECSLCSTPTQRRAYRANHGLCSPCRKAYDAGRGEQTTLLLPLDGVPATRAEDLANVVLLADRRPKGPRR